MERVRDKVERGGKKRKEMGEGAEEGLENKMAEGAETNRMGGELWRDARRGEVQGSPLTSHYLQRHAVKALPLHPYKDICGTDSGISPSCKCLPNVVINCFHS